MCLSLCCFCVNRELPQLPNGEHDFVEIDEEVTIHVVIYEYLSPHSKQPGTRLPKIIEEDSTSPNEIKIQYQQAFLSVDRDEFLIKNVPSRVDNSTECLLMQRKDLAPFYDPTNEPQIPNDRPTLFLIHGVGGSYETWTHQIGYFLNRGYRIVVPNLIGHGQSSRVNDASKYETKLICQQMLKVFDTYATNKNVIIGHSYG
jgi:predicted alpha/beta-fold hydrolase